MSTITDWIGVSAASVSVILTLLIAVFLKRYAEDTRRLTRIGQEQLEAVLRPIIAVSQEGQTIRLKNVGFGAALNVHWERYMRPKRIYHEHRALLAVGDSTEACDVSSLTLMRDWDPTHQVFSVTYASIAGQQYRTLAAWNPEENGSVLTLKVSKIA